MSVIYKISDVYKALVGKLKDHLPVEVIAFKKKCTGVIIGL